MSITLYTPATGFPDLEVKIAYGLARVGIEAFGMEKVVIKDKGGFYTVVVDVDENGLEKLDKTFNMLCRRLLTSEYIPMNTPGIKKSGKGGGFVGNITFKVNENFTLSIYKQSFFIRENVKDETVCCHNGIDKVGTVLGLAAESGYHHSRDKLDFESKQDKNKYYIGRPSNPKRICKICSLLSLIGLWYGSFVFNIMDKQYKVVQEIVTIPIPKLDIKGNKLEEIFSLQHHIRKTYFPELPQVLIPLVFLSKIPSSADILEGFDLFIAVLSRQQGYHVDGLFLIPIENYLDFIRQTPYNIATIDKMLNTFGNKRFPKEAYDALIELNNAIYYRKPDSLSKFARIYTLETTPKDSNKWTNLLYSETSKYFLKEVAMISLDIIENPSLQSLARTLRYFIRERKYGYADNIRNARKNSKDFEDTIAKMLREGELRRVQQEQDKKAGKNIENWIHLPKENEIKEVFRLIENDFEATKTALVILAFSFPSTEDKDKKDINENVNQQ